MSVMGAREALVSVEWPDLDEEHEYVMTARVRVRDGSPHIDTGGSQMVVGLGCTFAAVPTTTWQRVETDPELPEQLGAVIHCRIGGFDNATQVAELLDVDAWYVVGEQMPYAPEAIARCFRVLWDGGDR